MLTMLYLRRSWKVMFARHHNWINRWSFRFCSPTSIGLRIAAWRSSTTPSSTRRLGGSWSGRWRRCHLRGAMGHIHPCPSSSHWSQRQVWVIKLLGSALGTLPSTQHRFSISRFTIQTVPSGATSIGLNIKGSWNSCCRRTYGSQCGHPFTKR